MLGLNTMIAISFFVLLMTPVLLSWFGKTDKVRVIKYMLAVFLLEVLILFSVRPVRDYFDGPDIASKKIVGYTQYFQYPMYFDYFFFMCLVLAPIAVTVALFFLKINKK